MNLSEALDIVVARTGHERFRALCDPADPAYDPAYPAYIIARAEQDEPPGWLEKAGNFIAAVGAHVATGMHTVDEETLRARLAICEGCDRYEPANDVCRICGCRMSVKASWAEQECPIGKWPAET